MSKIKGERIRIRSNYSFWRHPIKWFRERRQGRLMEFLLNDTEMGQNIQAQARHSVRELMINGRTKIGNQEFSL